jgi:two-component system, OmpR family, KDP operon response regulator KdpE
MTTNLRILVVDDEKAIRRFLRASLTSHEYQVIEAETGREGLTLAAEHRPELIILDLGLPDMDGIEVTRQLREWYTGPIVILSVRDQENDKIAALDAGADDYLTKPFGVGELMARIRAALRHIARPVEEPIFEQEGLKVDLARRMVLIDGVEVNLTPTEYDILRLMVQHAGRVLTHRQILREVWGPPYENETHLLRVNMSNLRRKIEHDPNQPHYITTEPGVGYRLYTGA